MGQQYKGITGLQTEKGSALNIGDFFSNAIFFNIVLSLAATVGLYFVASFLFVSSLVFAYVVTERLSQFEPWHMITSFAQYMLMSPSYIAVLNVYAFANVHDVSWGTKGDNKVSTDLGVVDTGKNKNSAEVMIPTEQTDINAAYEDAMQLLQTKPPKVESKPDAATVQEDYYRTFRTNVLLSWTLTNGLLAAVITCVPFTGNITSVFTNGLSQNDERECFRSKCFKDSIRVHDFPALLSSRSCLCVLLFFGFLRSLFLTLLAVIRFIGSTTYLIVRLFAGE